MHESRDLELADPHPQGGVYNYAEVTVRKKTLEVAYKDTDGNVIQDWDGDACGPYTTR